MTVIPITRQTSAKGPRAQAAHAARYARSSVLRARITALETALAHAEAALVPVRDMRLNGARHDRDLAAVYGAMLQATTRTQAKIDRLRAELEGSGAST